MKTAAPAPAAAPDFPTSGTMRAIVQDEYGSRAEDVLRFATLALPQPADDQVLVRVLAASVDRGTWHVMSGLPYPMRAAGFGVRKPKAANPGRCFAGVVEAVGRDVAGFTPGTEVYGTCRGSFGELAVADAGKVAPKPGNLTFAEAATAPISAVTALQAVRDRARVQPGDRVLVIGASGGVGSFAVQIAKAFGAEVTGVCSTSKMDMVAKLGADAVVDYSAGDFLDGRVRYDVILDTGGNSALSRLRRALSPAGRLVIVGSETESRWFGALSRNFQALFVSPLVKQKLLGLMASENSEDLAAVAKLIESGKVTPAIDRTYALEDAAAAVTYVQEGRAQGKVAILV